MRSPQRGGTLMFFAAALACTAPPPPSASAGAADRYDVFELDSATARFRFRIPETHYRTLHHSGPIVFDRHGHVVHPVAGGFVDGQPGPIRLHYDSTGATTVTVELAYIAPDSLGWIEFEREIPSFRGSQVQRRTYHAAPPGTPVQRIAHSPAGGGYAEALSSRYAVHWHDDQGTLLRVVTRPVDTGPPFSAAERAAMGKGWSGLVASAQGELPDNMPIPTHKHPIEHIFFDLDGRLWVLRTRADTASLQYADVFDLDGTYSFTLNWPVHVDLMRGAIRGNVAYGISRDEYDVTRFVRLRIPLPE